MCGHEREVDVAAFLDRLAAVHRFEHGQFARLLLNDAGDAVKILAPLAAGQLPPPAVEGAARGLDRGVHVVRVGGRDLGELLFRGRVDGIEVFARVRRGEFPVDKQLVTRGDGDVFAVLGRRRVIPLVTEVQLALAQGHDHARGGTGERAVGFHGGSRGLLGDGGTAGTRGGFHGDEVSKQRGKFQNFARRAGGRANI